MLAKMRIIAGELKGRRLESPDWPGVRPTSDRLRETLFNVLGERVKGARVLDACAGTGALGLEALSRGAGSVVFLEREMRAVSLIVSHIKSFRLRNRSEVICGTLPGVMKGEEIAGCFDLILLDPPYESPQIDAILSVVGRRLLPGGLLVLERRRRSGRPIGDGLTSVRVISSGQSSLEFYEASRTA